MKLNSIFYALTLALLTSTAYAQVKIGTNPGTIGATSNLEVESSNGTKVVVDKTNGNLGAGVTDPTHSIDGAGTARLRNIPVGTNNQILTTDANGIIFKQNAPAATLPVVYGVTTGAGVNLLPDDISRYTGTYIILPANSRYVVSATMLMTAGAQITGITGAYIRSYFSDSPTGLALTGDIINNNSLISGSLSTGQFYSLVTGSVILQNSTNIPKAYYYVAYLGNPSRSGSGSVNLPPAFTIAYFGGNTWGENQLYAVPIN
ncbi:hypothetical protein IC229_00865 [Spirosoma sp. BT702]|uniref:Uncharacterized protein n=1 Tax=Spirosoma profusum TaxID=2771354 RepID=A0A926XWM6_9BACT|nr:hypothetical protein [Spirosoma profusum]MBD2699167.1 hypothetical protein [Spirosoma profusum]